MHFPSKQRKRSVILSLLTAFAILGVAFTEYSGNALATTVQAHASSSYHVNANQEPSLSTQQEVTLLRQKVKYVFVLYQENRSFDSYFGTFPGADGLYSQPTSQTPGFNQVIVNTDGTTSSIHPFRIGPKQYAADTDDVDHSHSRIDAKMNVIKGVPQMNQFAITEEGKYSPTGNPSLQAKQFGELSMAYEDCSTVPFLWQYANRFVLYDHIFQLMTGPSTPGNLAIIAAQSGQTQEALHPSERYTDNGGTNPGEPVMNDNDPFWGSPADKTKTNKQPVNPTDFPGYGVALNQTYATLPLTLAGKSVEAQTSTDNNAEGDLNDVKDDIPFIDKTGNSAVPWGWYEEGYDKEPTDPNAGPSVANGTHASYITHHNGPQYFGYVSNNPQMSKNLHGLNDFFTSVSKNTLPNNGGVYYLKGGYQNIFGYKPGDPDPKVQKNFIGDDDHPGYSDAQIGEATLAREINTIALSKYWSQSAIVVTYDDSEGDYDHVQPPVRSFGPDGSIITDGPRVPFIMISPYGKSHYISHDVGDHGSVVKFVDMLYGLTPLANLPDEQKGFALGKKEFGQTNLGPDDGSNTNVTDLLSAFDPARLAGKVQPLPGSYAAIPNNIVNVLPQVSGYGCKQVGVTPVDIARGIPNQIPADFNPRPKTNPSKSKGAMSQPSSDIGDDD